MEANSRWRHGFCALGVAGVLGFVAYVGGLVPLKDSVVGPIPWVLDAVAPDARTLTISHELPHCETTAERPTVEESATAVHIVVPEVPVRTWGEFCTADYRSTSQKIQLASPLGRRKLTQPGQEGQTTAERLESHARDGHVGARECLRLMALADDAPAREVPWVDLRLRVCTAPLPTELLRLPVYARPKTDTDQLPAAFHEKLKDLSIVLRPESARRLAPPRTVWLIPGPKYTCLGRNTRYGPVIDTCTPSRKLARRGVWAHAQCHFDGTPTRTSLVGAVPRGVTAVRLKSKHGARRSVPVRGGGWSAANVSYPLEISYGEVRFRTTYEKRVCLG